MKTVIILIIAVLFSFNVSAQLSADSISRRVFMEYEFIKIDTFDKISSGNIDTLMFSEIISKKDLPFDNIPIPLIPNNDTIYKLTDIYRLDYLRSLKVVRYRQIKKFTIEKIEKPIELQMSDLAKKRFKMDYDIDLFWNNPKVKAITDE